MATKRKHRFRVQEIPRVVQGQRLCAVVPGSSVQFRKATMEWTGCLQPSALSPGYRVRIVLAQGGAPKARVVSPKLENREGQGPPHRYRDGSLCLYHPKTDGHWDGTKLVSETILPWTAEWLFHYEVWLATGEWTGGGIGHDVSKAVAA